MRTYSIRELAKEFDVTARALRFYEDKGLLSPQRNGQMRIYSGRDRARLKLVLRGKRLGFSLDDIREMMDLYDLEDGQVSQLTVTVEKLRSRIKVLERQKLDVELSIADLQAACGQAEDLLQQKIEAQENVAKISRSSAGLAGPIPEMVTSDDHV